MCAIQIPGDGGCVDIFACVPPSQNLPRRTPPSQIYNSFVVPIVQLVWSAEGDDKRTVLCQVLFTTILLPYEMATTFFGCSGAGVLADVAGELEGSLVELAGEAAPAAEEGKEDTFVEGINGAPQMAKEPSEETGEQDTLFVGTSEEDTQVVMGQLGPPSKGALKRMKRDKFLQRVRGRRALREAQSQAKGNAAAKSTQTTTGSLEVPQHGLAQSRSSFAAAVRPVRWRVGRVGSSEVRGGHGLIERGHPVRSTCWSNGSENPLLAVDVENIQQQPAEMTAVEQMPADKPPELLFRPLQRAPP